MLFQQSERLKSEPCVDDKGCPFRRFLDDREDRLVARLPEDPVAGSIDVFEGFEKGVFTVSSPSRGQPVFSDKRARAYSCPMPARLHHQQPLSGSSTGVRPVAAEIESDEPDPMTPASSPRPAGGRPRRTNWEAGAGTACACVAASPMPPPRITTSDRRRRKRPYCRSQRRRPCAITASAFGSPMPRGGECLRTSCFWP